MQDAVLMRVLHRARYFRHQRDAFARLFAQSRADLLQAAAGGVFHDEEGEGVLSLANFMYRKNVRVIETGRLFRFALKTCQRLGRISLICENTLEGYDPPRVALSGPVDDAHPATPDLFENFVIAQ